MPRLPSGAEVLGATPAKLLLAPVLRPAPALDRQRALLDLQAIQRIPGLAGYWSADPAYIYEDSSGTIPAVQNGLVGVVYDISKGAVGTPLLNGLKYSEDQTNSVWVKTDLQTFGSGSVADATTAPDGTLTADKIAETATTAVHYSYQQWITRNIVPACVAISLKAAERTWAAVYGISAAVAICYVNLSTGAIGTVSGTGSPVASVEDQGNGWYRVVLSFIQPTGTDLFTGVIISTGNGVTNYAGSAGSGIYVWGAQANLGRTPAPYQKTTTGLGEYVPGAHAVQTTTANKPYLRRTSTSLIYWLDSDILTSSLTATLSNLGSACTVARAGAEGVTFTEGVTISSTYNIAPAFGFNADIAIFSRALTATEKALVTRYMQRAVPLVGNDLVTNGTFASDITGWSAFNSGILSHDSGGIKVLRAATNYPGAVQTLATTPGTWYLYTAKLVQVLSEAWVVKSDSHLDFTTNRVDIMSAINTPRTARMMLPATGANTSLYLLGTSTTPDTFSVFDDIAVRAIS